MAWWTTEQVAEYLDVTPQAIYDSRARQKFPGNLGSRRGRGNRLVFPSEAIEAGKQAVEAGLDPDTPQTTDDATTAILWALSGIHETLRAIHNEMRGMRRHLIPIRPMNVTVQTMADDEATEDDEYQGADSE